MMNHQGCRILLVGNSETDYHLIQNFLMPLETASWELDWVLTPEDALAAVQHHTSANSYPSLPYHLVLMNVSLHSHSGLKLLQTLVEQNQQAAKKQQEIWQENEEKFRSIFNQAAVGIAQVSLSGQFLMVNQKLCDLLGYDPAELTQLSWQAITYPQDIDPDCSCYESLMNGDTSNLFIEKCYIRKDGVSIFVNLTVTLVRDATGNPNYFIAVIQDISDRKQAEAAMQSSQNRLLKILETVGEGITLSDTSGNFEIFNHPMEIITGYTKEEANHSDNFLCRLHSLDQLEHQKSVLGIESVLQHGIVHNIETTICTKEGIPKTLLVSTSLVKDGDKNCFLSVYRDITQRKHAEQALAKERNTLAEAQKIAHVGSWEFDFQTQEITWSEETFRIFGFDPSQPGIKPPTPQEHRQQIHPEDRAMWTATVQTAITEKRSCEFEFRIVQPSGTIRYIFAKGNPICNQQGEIQRLFGTVLDITDRKQIEEELRQSKHLIERIADATPAILYVYDLTLGCNIYVNHQLLQILGYTPEEVQINSQKWFQETLDPNDFTFFEQEYARRFAALKNGEIFEHEYRQKHKNGQWRWMRSRNVVFTRTAEGSPQQILGTASDITAQKLIEMQLWDSEARLHTIINNTLDGILIVDQKGSLCFANPAAAQLFDRTLEDLLNQELGIPLVMENTAEINIVRPNGTLGVGEMSVAAIEWSGEPAYLVSVRDITERCHAEEALRESEERFRQMAETIQDVFWLYTPEHQVLYVSPAYEQVWGRSCGSIYQNIDTWLDAILPEYHATILENRSRMLQGESISLEYQIRRSDGECRWIWDRGFPIADEFGRVCRMVGIAEDITARKQAEAQLRHRLTLETALAEVSRELATNEAADLNRILGIVSQAVGVNRAYLTQMQEDSRTMSATHEWCDAATPAQIQHFQNWDMTHFPWMMERLNRNEIVVIPNSSALPEAAKLEKERLLGLNVCSLLVVPIYTQNSQLWGTIGLENVEENYKNWLEEDVQLLRVVAEIIYSDFAKKQALAAQLRQTQYRNLLTSITLKIRQSLHIDEILSIAVDELQKTLQADRVIFYRLWSDGIGEVVNEAVVPGVPRMQGEVILDQYCRHQCQNKYQDGYIYAFSDLSSSDFEPCYFELMERYQIRANLVIPIIVTHEEPKAKNPEAMKNSASPSTEMTPPGTVWGLLCVQQCYAAREWTHFEQELLQQLANQLSIALYQAQLLETETRQRQDLARSNAELEQFAYVASHDLQAPLQTITSYAKLLERRYQDQLDEKAHKFIHHIVDGSLRLQGLINDLLEYSRVDRKGKPFQLINCQEILKKALANLKTLVRRSQAIVTWDELPMITGDAFQLVQLFQNLISNGIKYHRAEVQPRVHIRATRSQEKWLFSVQDNGIGIEPQYQERIFLIFQRLHTQDEYPGTGIGLAICHKIIERHGGRIWVESDMGQGCTFYFTIPEHPSP